MRSEEVLVALAQHSTEFGCGVTVTKSLTWTADDEAKAMTQLRVDLPRHYGEECFGAPVDIDV